MSFPIHVTLVYPFSQGCKTLLRSLLAQPWGTPADSVSPSPASAMRFSRYPSQNTLDSKTSLLEDHSLCGFVLRRRKRSGEGQMPQNRSACSGGARENGMWCCCSSVVGPSNQEVCQPNWINSPALPPSKSHWVWLRVQRVFFSKQECLDQNTKDHYFFCFILSQRVSYKKSRITFVTVWHWHDASFQVP